MRHVSGCSEVFLCFLPVFDDFRHFLALFTRNSPVEGSVRWPFLSFVGNFCHAILLLKGPFSMVPVVLQIPANPILDACVPPQGFDPVGGGGTLLRKSVPPPQEKFLWEGTPCINDLTGGVPPTGTCASRIGLEKHKASPHRILR